LADYARTMLRLRELPARIIHAGHEPSFGRDRLIALAKMQLRSAHPGEIGNLKKPKKVHWPQQMLGR
jgi:hypothetical protein